MSNRLSKAELRAKRDDCAARREAYRIAMIYRRSGTDKDIDIWFYEDYKKRKKA